MAIDRMVSDFKMRLVVLIAVLILPCVASASPVPLVCRGDITIYGQEKMKLDNTGSILDLEKRSFTAPAYGTFPIMRADETTIVFGSETPTNSTLGNLDRISGSLTMTLMPPAERNKLKNGGSAHITAFVDAKCLPAKRMF
jgi:hypothetical protein